MNEEHSFLEDIRSSPDDWATRLVFADWLEERGDPRGELLRLTCMLTQTAKLRGRARLEARLRKLLAEGLQPVGPFVSNALGMRFACIPPGTFLMGSPPDEEGREYANEPLHEGTLTRAFYLGVHPVTQAQWRVVMGANPSSFDGDDHPVDSVTWSQCRQFCRKLGKREGQRYRLPTEEEWEYACRAGTTTPYHFGNRVSTNQVNCDGSRTDPIGLACLRKPGCRRQQTTPVGSFPANAFGLYDMHGNVEEWCVQCPGPEGHEESVPYWDAVSFSTKSPMLRGGSWLFAPGACRSAARNWEAPDIGCYHVGCRLVLCVD
jgi:uncharacterized protein (TIGR02996 family)